MKRRKYLTPQMYQIVLILRIQMIQTPMEPVMVLGAATMASPYIEII